MSASLGSERRHRMSWHTRAVAMIGDYLAPGLTFVGAMAVALIAAVTAGRRQTRELSAERERLDDRLKAEQHMHAQQLAHDRALRDLDDLRELLGRAVEHLYDAAQAFVFTRGAAIRVSGEPTSEEEADVHSRRDKALTALQLLDSTWHQLTVRLESTEPELQILTEIRVRLGEALFRGLAGRLPLDAQLKQQLSEVEARIQSLHVYFLDAVYQRVGSRLVE